MNFRYTMTVEVWRAPERTRFGDVARTKHHDLPGCVLAPRYSNEATDNQNRVVVGFTLFARPGSDVLADDRIKTPDGNFYDCVGECVAWTSPFSGWSPGVEVALERVT